jgi:hypothetical protein
MNPEQLEREQEAAHRAFEAEVAKVEQRIAALDQNLKAEVLQERGRAIREEAVKALADKRKAIAERASQATALLRRHTPEATRRAALDGLDPNKALATFATLSRSSTSELVARLHDAVDSSNLALAEATRLEFGQRPLDERQAVQDEFRSLFGKLRTPEAENATRALNRAAGILQVVDVRLAELLQQRSDPMARLAAHRAHGPAAGSVAPSA